MMFKKIFSQYLNTLDFLKKPFYGYRRLSRINDNFNDLQKSLDDDGFVVLENIFNDHEIKQINAHIERILVKGGSFKVEYENDGISPRQLWDFAFKDWKLTRQLILNAKLLSYVRNLVGYEPFLFRSTIMMKKAKIGSELAWHQDHTYWPISPSPVFSAWIALEEATVENGCMKFLKGEHKLGLQEYIIGEKNAVKEISVGKESVEVLIPCKAGDVILFNSLIPHSTDANKSNKDRKAAICTYVSANHSLSQKNIGEGKWRLMI